MGKVDLTNKKIALFATTGGSWFGKTVSELEPSAKSAVFLKSKLLNRPTDAEIKECFDELEIPLD